ncbi:RNA methyltransferase [Agrococcus baldri]|uniref:RNA methyltransferase n=1 Tax=Agrococcus baldri TaxID=153730 RepID=A0AA87RH81_9MICO|nr:RNA methyltransferase [Agrococcus baldri]
MALRSGVRLDTVVIAHREPRIEASLEAELLHGQVPVRRLSDRVAAAVLGCEKRPRVLAVGRRPLPCTLDALARRTGDIVVLDGVRLVGNIGAIIRSASARGAAGVVLVDPGPVAVHDRRVVRASRGLVFALPVVIADRDDLRRFLQSSDIPLVSLTATAAVPLAGLAAVPRRVTLLLGGERRGSSRELEDLAEHRFAVPMASAVESLNVSVVGALALFVRRGP